MSSRTISLTELENLIGTLEDIADQLEAVMAPDSLVAAALDDARRLRDRWARIYADRVAQLEDFIRRTGIDDETPATTEPFELVIEEED